MTPAMAMLMAQEEALEELKALDRGGLPVWRP
jgi:hypothetical protein